MADSANVLEEFLVSVVYDVDETKRKEFTQGLVESQVKAKLLGDALEAMALRAVAAIERYTTGMERLYYVSRNSGASVQNLQALGFAASQFGSTAEEAAGAVAALNDKLKQSPGFGAMLGSMGIATQGRDRVDILRDTIRYLSTLPDYLRRAREEQLGISENLFQSLKNNDEIQKQMDRFTARQRQMGLNPQKAAADAVEFMRSWRDLGSVLDNIGSLIESRFLHELAPRFTEFTDYLALHGDDIARIVIAIMTAISDMVISVVKFLPRLDEWVKSFGGWETVLTAIAASLLLLYTRMVLLGALVLPPWLLAMLGVGAAAVKGGDALKDGFDKGFDAVTGPATEEQQANRDMGVIERGKRIFRRMTGGGEDPVPLNLPEGKPGQYRPVHELSERDLSDEVVGTIAGEAQNNQKSIDAVINVMMNRVGSGGYGPDRDLQQVVSAPGQFAAHGHQASRSQAAFIRERLKAIASGKVADITRGANEFRGSYYHGAWYQNHINAPVIGGNRYARNDSSHGKYHSYDQPHSVAEGDTSIHEIERQHGYVPRHDGTPGSVPVPPIQVPGGVMVDGKFRPTQMGSGIGTTRTPALAPITTTNSPSVENHFNINGAMSPKETADAVHQKQADSNADLVRNMRNSVG